MSLLLLEARDCNRLLENKELPLVGEVSSQFQQYLTRLLVEIRGKGQTLFLGLVMSSTPLHGSFTSHRMPLGLYT